ncbi:MAG: hypothetical protein HZC17_00290 [Candidatus Omnitrophica bacterium]|nr:hypothetical protein [Candidatus Omnitrophota bacterium]
MTLKEISEAIERIELGVKQKMKMNDKEKEMTAYHETGHLIVTYLLHPIDDVFKASIIPRKSSLGVVHHTPREEYFSQDRETLLANIKSALAGYVAEKVKFGTTTTGVAADFRQAMAIAHNMVWKLGMGPSNLLGDFTIIPDTQISNDIKMKLNYDTSRIIQECLKEVEELLRKENEVFERFARELLKREELEFDEIEAIFNEYGKSNPRIIVKKKQTKQESSNN